MKSQTIFEWWQGETNGRGVARVSAGVVGLAAVLLTACDRPLEAGASEAQQWSSETQASPAPIGLALEVTHGVPTPLQLHAGASFYLEQLDMSTIIPAAIDEGVSGLDVTGDFASADWSGLQYEEQEFAQIPDAQGRFTRSRFYRGAAWMKHSSQLLLWQLDADDQPLGPPLQVNIGSDENRHANDYFFVRRLRAIQRTFGCPTATDCSGATQFDEEALVELRNALDQSKTFALDPATAALKLLWTANAGHPYIFPVEQIASPTYDYGFQIDAEVLTASGPDGWYLPGQQLTFQVTLRDGSGHRLHPEGSLPSYNEVIFGANEPGFEYFQGFFDPAWVFWRRKHRERTFIAHFMGPAQNVKAINSIVPLDQILTEDVQSVATIERDGLFDVWKVFPSTDGVFGGAFDPQHAAWAEPGSDTFSVQLPDNAPPGTYRLTTKARRVYHGEDIAATRTIEVQVGTAGRTTTTLATGNCQTCHSDGGSLAAVLHRNTNRGTCYGCHAPLAVEYDAPIHVRTHFIHSRSDRFDAPVGQCSTCHFTPESVLRTSKSACLSCHTSYPADHVAEYGPVTSIYVGGQAESFTQCTASCHSTHPNSGF